MVCVEIVNAKTSSHVGEDRGSFWNSAFLPLPDRANAELSTILSRGTIGVPFWVKGWHPALVSLCLGGQIAVFRLIIISLDIIVLKIYNTAIALNPADGGWGYLRGMRGCSLTSGFCRAPRSR